MKNLANLSDQSASTPFVFTLKENEKTLEFVKTAIQSLIKEFGKKNIQPFSFGKCIDRVVKYIENYKTQERFSHGTHQSLCFESPHLLPKLDEMLKMLTTIQTQLKMIKILIAEQTLQSKHGLAYKRLHDTLDLLKKVETLEIDIMYQTLIEVPALD